MKKAYNSPSSKVYEFKVTQMIAESIQLYNDEVDAASSLTSRFSRDGRFHRGDDADTELKELMEE